MGETEAEQGQAEATHQHPSLPSPNPPTHFPHETGSRGGNAGHTQGAAHISPSCSGSSSPPLEPRPSALAAGSPVTAPLWPCGSSSLLGREKTGCCAIPPRPARSRCHGLLATRRGYLWVLGRRWVPSLSSSLAWAARLSGLAPGWAPKVGASVETQTLGRTEPGDPRPTAGHSSCPSPLRLSLPRAAWG